jgi:hypothetical protein
MILMMATGEICTNGSTGCSRNAGSAQAAQSACFAIAAFPFSRSIVSAPGFATTKAERSRPSFISAQSLWRTPGLCSPRRAPTAQSDRMREEFPRFALPSNDCSPRFRIRPPPADVLVAIDEKERGGRVPATFFCRQAAGTDTPKSAFTLLRHALMTMKIVVAVHFEALRLWTKRVLLHTPPGPR